MKDLPYSHYLGGYDWQQETDSDPVVNAYLASLWQLPQEVARGVGKTAYNLGSNLATGEASLKGTWQDWETNLQDAWKKANVEAGGNIEGILAASTMPNLRTLDAERWDKTYGTTLASGGLIDLYRYGGFI